MGNRNPGRKVDADMESQREARNAALRFLDRRDSAGDGSVPVSIGGRSADRARAGADATMDRVRGTGWPAGSTGSIRSVSKPSSASRSWRVAALAAAAILVAAASSALTVGLIRQTGTVNVRFVLEAPGAESVRLAADFNQWSPDGYELRKEAGGEWSIVVPLRKGKSYAYNFIIDGERWIVDPAAPLTLDDGFGGSSSALSL